MRDPFLQNAEAEWRAGKPRPKPCTHHTLVNLQRRCDPAPVTYCATCGKHQTEETR